MQHGVDPTLRNHERETALQLSSPSLRRVLLAGDFRSWRASAGVPIAHALRASWRGDAKWLAEIIVCILRFRFSIVSVEYRL